MNKNNKRIIIMIVICIVIQSIVFVIAGYNKSYIHMDEAYSFRTCKL